MSEYLTPDLIHAEEFLELLDPDASAFTFQTFDDSKNKDRKLAGHKPGTLEQHKHWLEDFNNKGAGVYVAVNETDGKGREEENIKRIRAVYSDTDGAPLDPIINCELEPSIIVKTSEGKYHVYWLVDGLSNEQFSGVQRSIAKTFSSDKSVELPQGVLRVPGFYHRKFEPEFVEMTQGSGHKYTAEQILEAFPPMEREGTSRRIKSHEIGDDPVVKALNDKGLLLSKRDDSGFNIVCPFEDEHTTASSESTTVFWPSHTGGFKRATFKCFHDHCADRPQSEFYDYIDISDEQPTNYFSEPLDPFVDYATPPFPLDVLPAQLARLCEQLSTQTGFDAGGYAFSYITAASGLLDHNKKVNMAIMSQPAIVWAALVSPSGGGKSPVMGKSMQALQGINEDQAKQSIQKFERWKGASKDAQKEGENPPPKPPFRQTILQDTTVEALADAAVDNPGGLIFYADELTMFIGSMDAYNSNKGASRDRGVYLTAFDGGSKTINRKNTPIPQYVPNLSLSILAGIQPEKLAELYSQRGGGSSDGLFQRFLVYAMREQKPINYDAKVDPLVDSAVIGIFDQLHEWKESSSHIETPYLCKQALESLQDYHNAILKVSKRTASRRLAEHLNKYPGFIGKLSLVLHFLECASKGSYTPEITLKTFDKALKLMRVLFTHSEAVYQVIEKNSGGASDLMRSAAEAILSKGWDTFQRGQLTRYATGWREEKDNHRTENALDLLIELGWITDITPAPEPGRRGRRSDGLFAVNPMVHETFKDSAERIKQARAERYEAIKKAAGERGR